MLDMLQIEHLLALADAYGKATTVEEKTVSSRVFHDSKKLAAIRCGADITVSRFNAALEWFAINWPEGAQWPSDVVRPAVAQIVREAAE